MKKPCALNKVSLITPYGSFDVMIPKERNFFYLDLIFDDGTTKKYIINNYEPHIVLEDEK